MGERPCGEPDPKCERCDGMGHVVIVSSRDMLPPEMWEHAKVVVDRSIPGMSVVVLECACGDETGRDA